MSLPRTNPLIVTRILERRAAGATYFDIAMELRADDVPTAYAGGKWWPATVRGIVLRHQCGGPAGTL